MLEFLDLPEPYKEYDLKKAILKNMKKFLLEFGRDFLFIDEEYHVQVGNNDYYVDLLFYHRELQCLVAIDLKIDDFKPEYMGKDVYKRQVMVSVIAIKFRAMETLTEIMVSE